jgi:post-segregation antitoxin (ccd killing protein)
MTQRITVSLPDDIAEHLAREGNVSAYVTTALRQRIEREQTRRLLAEHGFPPITDEGIERARQRRLAVAARMTPERYAALRDLGREG